MGFLTKEFRTRLNQKLNEWAVSEAIRLRERLYELIVSLPGYIDKYGGYTATTFLLSLPFNLKNRKQDAANLITQLYLVVLEAKNIVVSPEEKAQIAALAEQIVNNGSALKKSFDELKAGLPQSDKIKKSKMSMFKSMAKQASTSKQPLAADILEMLEKHGLVLHGDNGYNLDAIPMLLFLHLVNLEQDLDISSKVKDLIGNDPAAIGDIGKMLIKFKQDWLSILDFAQRAVIELAVSGLRFEELYDSRLAIYILFHTSNDQLLAYVFAEAERRNEVDSLALMLIYQISNMILIKAALYESTYEIDISNATRLLRHINGISNALIKKEMQVTMLGILLDSNNKYIANCEDVPTGVKKMIEALDDSLGATKAVIAPTSKPSTTTSSSGATDGPANPTPRNLCGF